MYYQNDSKFTELGLKRLKDSYMLPHEESPQERFRYIADSFGSNQNHADRLYDYMSAHWLSPSSPILSFGKEKKGLPVSCYLAYLPDSSEGLVDTLSEVNWLSMMGGGVGIGVGIRSEDKKSAGVLPHLKVYEASKMAYRQGDTRRGSYAAFLDISHPNIVQFIEMRKPTGDQNFRCLELHHGVNIPDAFMEEVKKCMLDASYNPLWELKDPEKNTVKSTVPVRRLWELLLTTRMQTGEPYILFIDHANDALPQWLKDRDLSIRQSNICCVAPETTVLTTKGHEPIIDLIGKKTTVWNGREWSDVTPFQTSEDDELMTVVLSDGKTIDCTLDHDFYVQNKKTVKTKAKDLVVGDKLLRVDGYPIIDGVVELDSAYTNGFFSGDGCCYKGKNIVYLYGEKIPLEKRIVKDSGIVFSGDYSYRRVCSNAKNLKDKFFVPAPPYSVASRVAWFSGLLDADGCVVINKENKLQTLQLTNTNLAFLEKVQEMLQTLGTDSKIIKMQGDRDALLPANNGTGEHKKYHCKNVYRLTISAYYTQMLLSLGLDLGRNTIERRTVKDKTRRVVVKELIFSGRRSPTYCFNEPKRHMGIFNGILTGQCEITLPTNEDRTAVCCLSSLNLDYYESYKDDQLFFYDVAEMLDNVLQYFIDHGDKDKIGRAVYSAMRERSIGVGTLGWHSYMQANNIPVESALCKSRNMQIFKNIRTRLDKANYKLAIERGVCPDAEGSGRMVRFSHLMAIAPNATSSLIMGNTSPSIEPFRGNAYRQDTMSGSYTNKNKHLDKIIKQYIRDNKTNGLTEDEIWSKIITSAGSVQGLDFLSDWEKDVFKTASEIDQMWLVDLAADRQVWVDQAQSLNLFFHADADIAYIHHVHYQAWVKGLKTLYYCRSDKIYHGSGISNQIERVRLDLTTENECVACEG